MSATTALLQANHRIMELHEHARQARLVAEIRLSGRANRRPLVQRIRLVVRALPRAIAG